MKPTQGGKREGAGAKKKPVKAISKTVSMMPDEWRRFDRARGKTSRGRFIAEGLGLRENNAKKKGHKL